MGPLSYKADCAFNAKLPVVEVPVTRLASVERPELDASLHEGCTEGSKGGELCLAGTTAGSSDCNCTALMRLCIAAANVCCQEVPDAGMPR